VIFIECLHVLVKCFCFWCKYILHEFIYLHEIVKIQNNSRKARGPDWNPSQVESGQRAGLWGPLLYSANQLHAALYIVSKKCWVKMDMFVVKLNRHSSSYETDQGEQPRKVFIDRCQNSRPTCRRLKSSYRRLAQLAATMFRRISWACIRLMTLGTLWDVLWMNETEKLYC